MLGEENELEQQTETITETKVETEQSYENLPKLEDLLKSEQDVKPAPELQGLKKVEEETVSETRTFTRKADQKKSFIKKRLKVLTGVYVGVLTFLLAFVGVNLFTLISLNKDINNNANTIQSEQVWVDATKQNIPEQATGEQYPITLNQPRDYDDDTRGLSFIDKLTILFKNLFG